MAMTDVAVHDATAETAPELEAAGQVPLDAPLYVAGHRGLVGSAVWRHLRNRGHRALIGSSSADLDLRDRDDVFAFFADTRPEYVILAAARVGGILANATRPAEFISDNLRIQVNVLDAAAEHGVRRLLFLGSSCVYPKHAPQPITEESLLTGALEPTNDAYAIAKIAGLLHVGALRRQYGCSFISAMPTNLYGPGDNFDLTSAHVLPAMIRRFHEAKQSGAPTVRLWGTGAPRREFLHVDDLARACVLLLGRYDDAMPINIGASHDMTIRELAQIVAQAVDYDGTVEWDATKPDGTPRKLLDSSRIEQLGWRPRIRLADGIRSTYAWYHEAALPREGRGTSIVSTGSPWPPG
jgi:GDP-L-fucose synthase